MPKEAPKQTPSLPALSVEEMLALASQDPVAFEKVATSAGHADPASFQLMLEKARERNQAEAARARPPRSPYSPERYLVAPDPNTEAYYIGLQKRIDSLINTITGQSGTARKRTLAKIQDTYKQIYDRERHHLVYDQIQMGKSLNEALFTTEDAFRERAGRIFKTPNAPYDVLEAEKRAMRGLIADSHYEVDMHTDILGPSWKFGELGIQNKRDGLAGGRRYWPRGKPDGSLEE